MPVAVVICLTVVIFFAILTPFMIMEHRKEKKIEEAAKEAQEAKAAVEAKLTALGLTAEDLKALGL